MDEKKLEKIDVSVVMTTWGHDKFIVQAIEGVLNQKFDGNIELLITNDRSPDETDKIVTNYLRNTVIPENIHVEYILNEKNLGAVKNFLFTIGISRGEFIGVCEGDDYWIDTLLSLVNPETEEEKQALYFWDSLFKKDVAFSRIFIWNKVALLDYNKDFSGCSTPSKLSFYNFDLFFYFYLYFYYP